MGKLYTIRAGASFRGDGNKLLTGGDQIELEDDVATAHADKVDLVPGQGEATAGQPSGEHDPA
ncbi:MAG: hypothetical protein RJA98_1072 [Pseudomonadota bacterium]|jgi:hypothetical protein